MIWHWQIISLIKRGDPYKKKYKVGRSLRSKEFVSPSPTYVPHCQYKDIDLLWHHQINDLLFFRNLLYRHYVNPYHYGMGPSLSKDPLPPSVSPPYMTFCQVGRGVNPLCNVFTKKFLEKILGKFGPIPPYL